MAPCVDEWTVRFPSERYDWRGRSCYYKVQWGQCSDFATVCAASCHAAHCGSGLTPLPESVVRHSPPAPPRSSWIRHPPLHPRRLASPPPPPQPPPPWTTTGEGDAPAAPPAAQCSLHHEYHIVSMESPYFKAAVIITPWDSSRVVRLHFSSRLGKMEAAEGARLIERHRAGNGDIVDFELLAGGASSEHFTFSATTAGAPVAFPDAITCDAVTPPRLPPPPRRPPRLRRPRPAPAMPPPDEPTPPPSPLPPSFAPPPSASPCIQLASPPAPMRAPPNVAPLRRPAAPLSPSLPAPGTVETTFVIPSLAPPPPNKPIPEHRAGDAFWMLVVATVLGVALCRRRRKVRNPDIEDNSPLFDDIHPEGMLRAAQCNEVVGDEKGHITAAVAALQAACSAQSAKVSPDCGAASTHTKARVVRTLDSRPDLSEAVLAMKPPEPRQAPPPSEVGLWAS